MALNKYIAVKICGNPDSNSGFTPIFLFNSPSFSIEDEFYVGFDNCSFFYTIRTTNTQTIYKLVKNNVRSYGASRAGSLVIAFSIPKGYALRNGCTPYDVLSKLKDTFLERCMTCKDAVRETYEFNQGRIDLKILDDVAQVFFIEPKSCPNRIMPPNAPKGYIVKNNLEIEQFFHDTNYPEFDNFSEIIIADSVTQTNYIPINNIQIPRRINYSIYVNGKFERSCDDLNEQLTAFSNKPKEYYDNKSVAFTIQELKDGKIIDGFAFDEIQERIDISTLNWAKPKSERFWIRIEPPKKFDNSLINRNLIKVVSTSGIIRLDNDLSFTLIGEQIADLRNLRYSLADNLRGKYKISSCKMNGDMITIAIDTIRMASDIEQQHRKFPPIPVPQDKLPVIDVQIIIEDILKLTGNVSQINAKFKSGEDTFCSQIVSFHNTKSSRTYEGHFYVPKNSPDGHIEFSIKDTIWMSQQIMPSSDDIYQLRNFNKKKKSFVKRNRGFVKLLAFALSILLFFILGFVAHNPLQSFFATPNTNQTSNGTEPHDTIAYSQLTDEEANAILKNAEGRLKAEDVSFEEIEIFYQKYNEDSVTLQLQDKAKFGGKICNRIKDYYSISNDIKSGNYDRVYNSISHINSLHIFDIHKKIITKITEGEDPRSKYMNEYSSFKSFSDIEKKLSASSNAPDVRNMERDNHQSNKRNEKKEKAEQNKSAYYDCEKCKKDGLPNYRFKTEENLKDHMKLHNDER